MLIPVTSRCIKRFTGKKRGFISFCILAFLFLISLAAELIANDKPLLIGYEGKLFFLAAWCYYPETLFGGTGPAEPDYKALSLTPGFSGNKRNFIIFPPVPFSPIQGKNNIPDKQSFSPPSGLHLLGTDRLGLDVFSIIIYGFRTSMIFAITLLVAELVIGTAAGALTVFSGRLAGTIASGFIRILSMFPVFLIAMFIAGMPGYGFPVLVILVSIFKWTGFSHIAGTWFSRIQLHQFPDAAKISGTGKIRMLFSEILPNMIFPVLCFAPISMAASLCLLSGLDFLGSGLPGTGWGYLLRQGTGLAGDAPHYWLLVFPLFVLSGTLLLLTFIGQGLRESMNQESCGIPGISA